LLTSDVVVQDEREPEPVPYWLLLAEYLTQMEALVTEFQGLLYWPKSLPGK
jgi:hypothetical protein